MSITSPRLLLSLYALPLLSCQELNPEFCSGHPDDVVCVKAADDKGTGIDGTICTSDAECTSPTPVCDKTRSMCVQCIADEPGACGGTAPMCGDDDTCRSCARDSECASMTCLPDGSCVAASNVLYVAPGGSETASCMAVDKCTLSRAIAAIDGTRTTIRLDPGFYAFDSVELILTTSMRIVGRGAVIRHGGLPETQVGNGNVVIVRPEGARTPTVELDYLELTGGSRKSATSGVGIACENATLTLREVNIDSNHVAGVTSFNCTLTISHSRIVQNDGYGLSLVNGDLTIVRSVISENLSGGLVLSGVPGGAMSFDLENNFIVTNGRLSSDVGGVLFDRLSPPGPYVFAFNTVALNAAGADSPAPGVICQTLQNAVPMFTNNIVYGNATPLASLSSQVEGEHCGWMYSDIGPRPPPTMVGGNIAVDPEFVDVAHGDFHLGDTSPVRNAADPAAAIVVDIDGEARPQGPGREMGADEIK